VAKSEEKQQRAERVAFELNRRRRLAVPTLVGGVFYMMSAVTISSALSGAPTVGVLQGLAPVIRGEAHPSESPRTAELKYISSHATALLVGSALAALAIGALVLALLFICDSTRFRRPNLWPAIRPLVLYGGIAVALISFGHQAVTAIETHAFAVSSDHSNAAVEHALTTGTAVEIVEYVDLFGGLALAVGMVSLMLNAMRVGLLPRWMSMFGMFAGLLLFLPIGGAQLQVVPALWMVFVGILFYGRWPGGDPPAWEAGEAIPWPSGREEAERKREEKGGGRRREPKAPEPLPAPEPVPATASGPSRKRRKRR